MYLCNKNRYKSEHEAKRVKISAEKQRSVRLRIYLCPDCHGWHLTSDISREPKREYYKRKRSLHLLEYEI